MLYGNAVDFIMSQAPKVRGGHICFSADSIGVGARLLLPRISLEPVGGISPNLHGYIIGTSLRAVQILVTLTPFSRSQEVKEG